MKHVEGELKGYRNLNLYYQCWLPSNESRKHAEEVSHFCNIIQGEVDFRTMTYQELYKSILDLPEVERSYIEGVGNRYFKE